MYKGFNVVINDKEEFHVQTVLNCSEIGFSGKGVKNDDC